jgi:hypothetical protein
MARVQRTPIQPISGRKPCVSQCSAPKRRGRRPKVGDDAASRGNGKNGRAVSPQTLWEHAAKLSPGAPWKIVAREFGVSESVARNAHRDGILPGTPRAAARFLKLQPGAFAR